MVYAPKNPKQTWHGEHTSSWCMNGVYYIPNTPDDFHIFSRCLILLNLFNDQDSGCSPRIWDGLFPRISRGLKRRKRGYSRSGIGQTENDNRPQTGGWFTSDHLKCWGGLTRISQSLISMARNAKVGNFPKTEQLIEGNDLPSGHCMHLRKLGETAEMGDSMQLQTWQDGPLGTKGIRAVVWSEPGRANLSSR